MIAPNNPLQQTGHANEVCASHFAHLRVRRLLSYVVRLSGEVLMSANRTCQVFAILCWLVGGILLVGPWANPDNSTGAAGISLFLLLLGLLVWVVGAFATLSERVERLERNLSQDEKAEASHQSPQR